MYTDYILLFIITCFLPNYFLQKSSTSFYLRLILKRIGLMSNEKKKPLLKASLIHFWIKSFQGRSLEICLDIAIISTYAKILQVKIVICLTFVHALPCLYYLF